MKELGRLESITKDSRPSRSVEEVRFAITEESRRGFFLSVEEVLRPLSCQCWLKHWMQIRELLFMIFGSTFFFTLISGNFNVQNWHFHTRHFR